MKPFRERRFLHGLCALYAAIWLWSAVAPFSRSDWFLENILVFLFLPLLVWKYRGTPLTDTSYLLVFLFMALHTVGAHYTYAEAPLGYWFKDWLHLGRNHFDRLVHFSFGLLLTYPAAEVLARSLCPRGRWAMGLAVGIVVGASGLFEIIETVVAWIVSPELGADYLGTQGDVWDAQKDMAVATIGAMVVAAVTWRGRGTETRRD